MTLGTAGAATNVDLVLSTAGTGFILAKTGYDAALQAAYNTASDEAVVTLGTLKAELATTAAAETLVRRAVIGFSATANVGAVLPTHAYVARVILQVTSAYNAGAAFTLTAGASALATDSEVNLQAVGQYVIDLYSMNDDGASQIVAAIAGGSSGAANVIVQYNIG
jgi:D-serine deaminase-like pyridoxal phosphate-dependent protein